MLLRRLQRWPIFFLTIHNYRIMISFVLHWSRQARGSSSLGQNRKCHTISGAKVLSALSSGAESSRLQQETERPLSCWIKIVYWLQLIGSSMMRVLQCRARFLLRFAHGAQITWEYQSRTGSPVNKENNCGQAICIFRFLPSIMHLDTSECT